MQYFIAYVLQDGERDAIDALRREIAERFDVRSALHLPPHLTLFYPFEHPDATPLLAGLAETTAGLIPVPLDTPRFASFGEATWYVDVTQDARIFRIKEAVRATVRRALGIEEEARPHGIHFHVTLAYRDVSGTVFRRIGSFLKTCRLPTKRIVVDALTLFEHRGGSWREFRTFPFANG